MVSSSEFAEIYNDVISRQGKGRSFDELHHILFDNVRKLTRGKSSMSSLSKGQLASLYKDAIKQGLIHANPLFDRLLTLKKIRSSSGVLPISVALDGRVFSCAYNCSYCPNECREKGAPKDMARSYLSNEGTFVRAEVHDFNIVHQVWRRLAELESMGHTPDKCEIITLGGTFDCFPIEYRKLFSLSIFYACNMYQYISIMYNGQHADLLNTWLQSKPYLNKLPLSTEIIDTLTEIRPMPELSDYAILSEQAINTTVPCGRIVGLVIETRPDRINLATLKEMRLEGATRVQLGIQSTNDDVLKFNNRGHKVKASIKANKLLRDAGFKVDGHLMPDLPGTTLEIDYQMVHDVFCGSDLQLDYTKIYPCLDLPYTQIREWKESGEWSPIAESRFPEFLEFLCYTLSIIPPWTRTVRVQRDFSKASLSNNGLGYVSDTIKTNLQQIVLMEMNKRGMKCYDIRSREVKNTIIDSRLDEVRLYIRVYRANEGTEFFISAELPNEADDAHFDDAILLGLCRLRIPDDKNPASTRDRLPSIHRKNHKVALIRELHTYGVIAPAALPGNLGQGTAVTQHKGVGTFLMNVAESIAYSFGCTMGVVISGVGVRNYYSKLGYTLEPQTQYMTKEYLTPVGDPVLFGKTYSCRTIIETLGEGTCAPLKPLASMRAISYPISQGGKGDSMSPHVYTHIQNGEAKGFRFKGSPVPTEEMSVTMNVAIALIFLNIFILIFMACWFCT